MTLDAVPFWAWSVGTILIVLVCIEVGYRLGADQRRRRTHELESPVSAMSAAILGLVAFMLAFTFGIASDRFDARKTLVLDEAGAIRTAWMRAEFLPEPDRAEAGALLRKYLDDRIAAVQSRDNARIVAVMADAKRIQNELWTMAVANARKDMNSDVAALYVEALNDVMTTHASRIAIGWHARIAATIWLVLYVLVALGMVGVGYQTGITGSPRSWGAPVLALAFSIVIVLIAALDRPSNALVPVPQWPLINLQSDMAGDALPGVESP